MQTVVHEILQVLEYILKKNQQNNNSNDNIENKE